MEELAQLPPEEQMRKITALCFELYFTGKFMGQLGNIKRATTAHIIKPGITSLANRLQLYHYEAISKTCTRMATTCKAVKNFTRRNINHWHGSENFEWVMDEFGNWKEVITVEAGPSIEVAISNGNALVPMGELYSVPSTYKKSISDVCNIITKNIHTERIEAIEYLKNQVVKNSTNLLPDITQQALITATIYTNKSFLEELPALKSEFARAMPGWGDMKNKFIKPQYLHIFGIDPKSTIKIKGLHHDLFGYLEETGIIKLEEIVSGQFGEYKARVIWNGVDCGIKCFFPKRWTPREVMKNICESYNNYMAKGIMPIAEKDGKFCITEKSNVGLEIKMYIDQQANLKTVYPVIK